MRRALLLIVVGLCLPGRVATAQAHEPDPQAMKAFVELIESYRKRPALTVHSKVKVGVRQGDAASAGGTPVEAEITFTRERRGVVKLRGFTCYLGDGELRAVHEGTEHSYFSTSDDGSPYYTLMTAFVDIPYPHLAIAFGEQEIDEFFCMQFHPKAPYARPTSVKTETLEDGRQVTRLKMTSDYATLDMVVDPETRLIETMELTLTGGIYVQEGSTMVYSHRFEYDTYDAEPFDPSVLDFDPANRQRVDLLATLTPKPTAPPGGGMGGGDRPGGLEGERAPAFTLATADGGAVDLADFEGQVVVLDFWATWCGPCRRALPILHDVARWASDEKLPVKIITVNVFEKRGPADTAEARLAAARAYWQESRFSLPVAMDYTDETAAAYGVQSIPATFVIRADGVVHAQHVGFAPDYERSLQADIQAAIDALEIDDLP